MLYASIWKTRKNQLSRSRSHRNLLSNQQASVPRCLSRKIVKLHLLFDYANNGFKEPEFLS